MKDDRPGEGDEVDEEAGDKLCVTLSAIHWRTFEKRAFLSGLLCLCSCLLSAGLWVTMLLRPGLASTARSASPSLLSSLAMLIPGPFTPASRGRITGSGPDWLPSQEELERLLLVTLPDVEGNLGSEGRLEGVLPMVGGFRVWETVTAFPMEVLIKVKAPLSDLHGVGPEGGGRRGWHGVFVEGSAAVGSLLTEGSVWPL